jgi:hypothetical protein
VAGYFDDVSHGQLTVGRAAGLFCATSTASCGPLPGRRSGERNSLRQPRA